MNKLMHKWRVITWLEAGLYGLGLASFVWLVFSFTLPVLLGVLLAGTIGAALLLKPWSIDLMQSARLVDRELDVAESSAVLLVQMQDESSMLHKLQQVKVGKMLENYQAKIRIPHHIKRGVVFSLLSVLVGYLIQFGSDSLGTDNIPESTPEVVFTPEDSTQIIPDEISIERLQIEISAPAYTGLEQINTSNPNLEILEGSVVKWQVQMSTPIVGLNLKSGGNEKAFEKINENTYEGTWLAQGSGFYNFEFFRGEERMISDIYKIELLRDAAPEIEVIGLDHHTRFAYDDPKQVRFSALIKDDFAIAEAHIIATVAKGSGESVKFREEQWEFDTPIKGSETSLDLSKEIDLDQMGLTPGDELYFYVQANDNMEPQANVTRTATYFLSIIDTTNIEFSLEGSLGVDLMPDYFRSQRQLIIETEQLIKDKPSLTEYDFNFKSNELGFDQKALRIRYGQFMGEEFESGIMQEDAEGNVIGEEDDPLAAYSHGHDTENEANLVAEEDKQEDLVAKYKDNHEDDEEATFFSVSIKEKLREAMAEMWDAELYLRLYQPEKSLPYQYNALELLKQIKNHARIYVHRIGFDPTPIKEESRLTGDLDEINSQTNAQTLAEQDKYRNIKRSIARMSILIESKEALSPADKLLFERTGNDLAALAIENPGAFLNTLQQLKQLSFDNIPNASLSPVLAVAYQGLIGTLPRQISQPVLSDAKITELKKAFLSQFDKISNE